MFKKLSVILLTLVLCLGLLVGNVSATLSVVKTDNYIDYQSAGVSIFRIADTGVTSSVSAAVSIASTGTLTFVSSGLGTTASNVTIVSENNATKNDGISIEQTATGAQPGTGISIYRIANGALTTGQDSTVFAVTGDWNASTNFGGVVAGSFKARSTNGNAGTCIQLRGVVANARARTTVTTAYGLEASIDVDAGKTITTAALIHANLNNSGTVTNSYGMYMEGVSGYNIGTGIYIRYTNIGLDVNAITTGMTIGSCVTGISMTGAYSTAALSISTTLAAAADYAIYSVTTGSGTISNYFESSMTTIGGTGVCAEVILKTSVALGNYAAALYAVLDLQTAGGVTGVGSAICGELVLPGGAAGIGTFGVLKLDVVASTSWTSSQRVSFFRLRASGSTVATFITNGYLFDINDLGTPVDDTAAIWHLTKDTAPTHALRCIIDGVAYDILMQASQYSSN